MEINWDSIKYIFQIPRDWFRYIHRKIHNAYGVLFIRVMDGEYGGMKIDIDKQVFKETVEDAINLDEYVKSVNDVKPDEKGNVDLSQNFLEASDITTPGMLVGTDYKGEQTVCSPNHKHNIKDVDGSIKTINGKSPDENGKITFSVVERVDGVEPVNGNVPLGAIRSINNTIRPVNGNVDLTGVFAPVEHTHPHTQISDWNNATKDFLEASELTSPGIVVGTDYDDPDHPVCYPNHKHNAKDIVNNDESGFVTVNTEQNITASKRFTNGSNLSVANSDSEGVFVKPTGQINLIGNETPYFTMNIAASANLNPPFQIYQTMLSDKITTRINQLIGRLLIACENQGSAISMERENILMEIYESSALQLGLDGLVLNYKKNNNFIAIADNQIHLKVSENGSIIINANANNSRLANQPTETNENSLAIATCGYVQKNAITIPEGKTLQTQNITVVTNVTWNGTQLVIEKKNLEFTNGVLTDWRYVSSSKIDTVAYNAN